MTKLQKIQLCVLVQRQKVTVVYAMFFSFSFTGKNTMGLKCDVTSKLYRNIPFIYFKNQGIISVSLDENC